MGLVLKIWLKLTWQGGYIGAKGRSGKVVAKEGMIVRLEKGSLKDDDRRRGVTRKVWIKGSKRQKVVCEVSSGRAARGERRSGQ